MIGWPRGTGSIRLQLLVSVVLLSVVVLTPLLLLLAPLGTGGSDTATQWLLADDLHRAALRSLSVGLLAVGLASILAWPIAWVGSRAGPTALWPLSIAALVAFAVPAFLTAGLANHFALLTGVVSPFGWMAWGSPILDPSGADGWLLATYALHYLPVLAFATLAGMYRVDRAYEETAINLGASRPRLWLRIILPLATPGYLLGVALTLLRILEDIGTPLLLGIDDLLAPRLWHQFQAGDNHPAMLASASTMLLVSLMLTSLAWVVLSPRSELTDQRYPVAPARWRHSRWSIAGTATLVGASAAICVAPLAWLIGLAIDGDAVDPRMAAQLAQLAPVPDWRGTLIRTLGYFASVAFLTLATALWFASLANRSTRCAPYVGAATTVLYAIPGVVLALAYLQLVQQWLPAPSSASMVWLLLAVVVSLKQLPLLQRLIAIQMRNLDPQGLVAIRELGGGLWASLHYGSLAMRGLLLGGASIAGIGAVMELSVALILTGKDAGPISTVLFDRLMYAAPGDWSGVALALVVGILIALLTGALMILSERPANPHTRPSPLREASQSGNDRPCETSEAFANPKVHPEDMPHAQHRS